MYRRYRIPTVWRELNRLQRDMDRMLSTGYPSYLRSAPSFPALNIWSNEDELIITAEVPGINPEDLDISVVGDNLTLKGERKAEEMDENARYHRQERGYGSFSRTVQLPFPVDIDKVDANFTNGVLEITMPRAEADKPRKIAVKSA
ncbi:MAG: Hsp20/alpha crystallin family protein [Anaerolineales bacterium]|jgi:HSP20 family protein